MFITCSRKKEKLQKISNQYKDCCYASANNKEAGKMRRASYYLSFSTVTT